MSDAPAKHVVAAGRPPWEHMLQVLEDPSARRAISQRVLADAGRCEADRLRDALADELALYARPLKEALAAAGWPPAEAELPDAPGLLGLDEFAARFLERVGERGFSTAARLRKNSRSRWAAGKSGSATADLWQIWRPDPPDHAFPFAHALADVLLHDVVRQREAPHPEETSPAGGACVTQGLAMPLLRALRSSTSVAAERDCLRLVDRENQVAELGPASVDKVARREVRRRAQRDAGRSITPITVGVYDDAMLAMLESRNKAMKSAIGQQFFREVVRQGHRIARETRQDPPVAWKVPSDVLAGQLGLREGKERDLLRKAMEGFSLVRVPVRGDARNGSVWLLDFDDYPARGPRPDRFVIAINHPLLPGYEHELEPGWFRLYVPVPSFPPPFVGSRNMRGQEMLFQTGFFLMLSQKSAQAVEIGGWEISEADWVRLADDCEIPARTLPKIRAAYVAPNADMFPVLVPVAGCSGLYDLGEMYAAERHLLLDQGEMRQRRAESGRRGAEARKARKEGKSRRSRRDL